MFDLMEYLTDDSRKVKRLAKKAKKLGYKLVRNTPRVPFIICNCGANTHKLVTSKYGYVYVCKKCGHEGPCGRSKSHARVLWNEQMRLLSDGMK